MALDYGADDIVVAVAAKLKCSRDDVADVKLMDKEIILQHVREWNRHKRIVIHCIGVDMQEGIELLQILAMENGGKYVDR